ncbi:hypothetical protein BAE44_0002815 [Dichanthelium oligosanthes]|uniref:Uncharacterized protein n=1 Tax=Dichanthelium oligosanthes TaxID=888268 RepID=A0A1E5WFL2_9POAL|nr:hypothetical protein BAE44_0002815 [Dichanthelium oligosanthes]
MRDERTSLAGRVKPGLIESGMGFQRKILGKRAIQVPEEADEIPQVVELRLLKLKRSRGDEEDGEGPRQLSSTANGAATERSLHCPPAPKKPRLVLGCSLDGFKVLRVMDLRCFLP